MGIKHNFNLDWLQQLAAVIKSFKGLWILGADFNCTPQQLEETGWLKLVGGVIVAPKMATCKGRTIDFFVVAKSVAGSVVGVKVVGDALFKPHCPVRLFINARPRLMTVRMLKTLGAIRATLPFAPPQQIERQFVQRRRHGQHQSVR